MEFGCGQVEPAEGRARLFQLECGQVVVSTRFDLVVFDCGARCEDSSQRALDEFSRLGSFHLIAYGHFLSGLESFSDILLRGVVGNTRHEVVAPFCKSDSQQLRPDFCVLVKHFVEVTETKQEQRVRGQVTLNLEVLLHHGSYLAFSHILTSGGKLCK